MDQPLPPIDLSEPMTTPPEPQTGILTEDQARRAVSLSIAKPLLTAQGLASKTPPTVDDLVRLAEWILSGETEELYPFLLSDHALQIGPEAVLRPDGFAVIKGVVYEPTSDDGHDGD